MGVYFLATNPPPLKPRRVSNYQAPVFVIHTCVCLIISISDSHIPSLKHTIYWRRSFVTATSTHIFKLHFWTKLLCEKLLHKNPMFMGSLHFITPYFLNFYVNVGRGNAFVLNQFSLHFALIQKLVVLSQDAWILSYNRTMSVHEEHLFYECFIVATNTI